MTIQSILIVIISDNCIELLSNLKLFVLCWMKVPTELYCGIFLNTAPAKAGEGKEKLISNSLIFKGLIYKEGGGATASRGR